MRLLTICFRILPPLSSGTSRTCSDATQLLIASANDIEQIATGEIVYAFGYTGLQILQQIVIADMTTLRYRCVNIYHSIACSTIA